MKYSTILKTVSIACALIPAQTLFAQLPEKVGGLITADRNAAIISKAQGPHAAFTSIIDKTSIFYVHPDNTGIIKGFKYEKLTHSIDPSIDTSNSVEHE